MDGTGLVVNFQVGIYYSAKIYFIAEAMHVYVNKYSSRIEPVSPAPIPDRVEPNLYLVAKAGN
jgi:hypothetical protein